MLPTRIFIRFGIDEVISPVDIEMPAIALNGTRAVSQLLRGLML